MSGSEGAGGQQWPSATRDHFQYVRVVEHYRGTSHPRFDIRFHLVWITKYRKKLLRGDVGLQLRQIVRTICAELEVEILKGHVSVDPHQSGFEPTVEPTGFQPVSGSVQCHYAHDPLLKEKTTYQEIADQSEAA